MHTMQELRTVKYARTTLYLRTLRKRNTHVLRLRYVNFFLAPTVYVRKTPSFFAYFASCQLEPDSGAWSIFTSSVEWKCEFGASTFVSFM